ncbi:iron-containing alcohol dehydrogenase family protein [Pseudoalteromonas byunsanensis]|uniref:Uncharacterized protein n=1 Tax=Pseudoalteromonas byunsanensis TaxID=327939 RepID=A0A1S1N695_9GAMM|nr:iron-containing alcohol dehydrogenase [Pseudoalteromonas byunsanensis]OHU95192.1 hypothetical protein BIW53_10730 [Pseudoalteromonas byunsanensis]
MNYAFHLPTKIEFGSGSIKKLGKHVLEYGHSAVLVTGQSALSNGHVELVQQLLELESGRLEGHILVSADPDCTQVANIVAAIKSAKPDVIIALGGGSVIDAAKAAAALHQQPSVNDWVGKTLLESMRSIPLIAIPTTAGTGSEVTKGAIIYDEVRHFKSGIRGEQLYPKAALIDPDLIITMPQRVMQETLFDAFTHLFETYMTRRSTPLAKSLSLSGLTLLADLLKQPELSLSNPAHRDAVMQIALFGGINIGAVGSCLPHRLQQAMPPISSHKVSHGCGLSSVYRAWIEEVTPYVGELKTPILKLFERNSLADIIAFVQAKLDMPTSLSAVGYSEQHIAQMCRAISGDLSNDPIESVTEPLIERIYNNAL